MLTQVYENEIYFFPPKHQIISKFYFYSFIMIYSLINRTHSEQLCEAKGFQFSTDPRLFFSPSSFSNISRFHFPLSLLTHLQVFFFSYDWQCYLAKVFSLWLPSSPLSPAILHSHIPFTSYFSSYTSLFLDFLKFVLPPAMPQLGK